MSLDIYIFNFLHQLAGKNVFLDGFIFWSAEILPYVFALVLWSWIITRTKNYAERKYVILIGVIGIVSAIISRFLLVTLIRLFIERPRPFVELWLTPLFSHEASTSFPSGHAAFFFALVPVMFLLSRKAGWVYLVVAILMGLSRIIAGVHWPSDILAGALIGLAVGWCIMRYALKIHKLLR
ncbi:MAG: hypothetical protein A3A80_02560 [Candidatus Terrybacteria bacterium RIFCSPLOWO2_01_FULL_44_24]|uniref:Phosphatidic acid phosphatase type 2/haloperoxidase domain-containing protein n=1 Tax=Candidatus Terrybacteria bacterium RIFCSPHIGHO2_01_FULL_43_35 TaxID=1802361 RepID=A0A1G2PG30_9BACT|nr:MAG: hypothetical protein A2828_02355 [Candidatus Terrybacteria bacterium RIFCSPHIGHO2_01_FULL_43_35]OHA50291.1 MAG: hypothetical protein A3B75_00640 [Candidatus Terrybacteria bacterium RIFCSPHIGHO2_02_FULL_43_14]OHA50956.1 MAG: hypothetical protein A3A80_02560 [Candidatus Terrybacteria bacterium RIFCSPLOWO2_01_FULL_44_24]